VQHVRASPDGKQREPFEAQGKQAPALHTIEANGLQGDAGLKPLALHRQATAKRFFSLEGTAVG
jgi:hypothetical protein